MNAQPPSLEPLLRKWFRTDRIEHARLEIVLALHDYEQTVLPGTQWHQVKSAKANLRAIETHAEALVRALENMPMRSHSALRRWLYLRPDSKGPPRFAVWLDELRRVGVETLLPLAGAAHGALTCLPERPPRGRPAKNIDTPRDALVRRLDALYREHGKVTQTRGDPAAHAFIREMLANLELPDLPDKISRLVKPNKSNAL